MRGRGNVSKAKNVPEEKIRIAPKKLLIAEDNMINQMYLRQVLNGDGHDTVFVRNGREVLEELSKQKFDLLISDIQMPEMDGLEMIRAIRRSSQGSGAQNLPVLALTAFSTPGEKEKLLKAGFSAYISKPVCMDRLRRIIFELSN